MATKFDLVCEQGADLAFVVNYRRGDTDIPVDITSGFARMQVRWSISAQSYFLDIDSGNKGGIQIEGPSGQFLVFVPATVTATFSPTREAVYDLQYVDAAGRTSRVIEGRFRVTQQITR